MNLILHPFHVSVTEIKYKEEKKAIQISTRIFLDDLEVALRASTEYETLDITSEEDWDFVNTHLEKYILANLILSDEKGRMETNYVGAEIENDVMWIYVEVEKVKKLKAIRVVNKLLTEVYNDQENIVHFRAFGKVKSARLYKGEEAETFDWE